MGRSLNVCLVLHKYDVTVHDPCCYPLGFMYVSSALKAAGYNVKVLNMNLFEYDMARELAGQDRVLFSGFEPFLPRIEQDAATAIALGATTVVGGPLATFVPKTVMPYVDTVVMGEADEMVLEAMHALGLVGRGPRPNIDRLPLPDYDGFGMDEYRRRHSVQYAGVLASRGCPFSCTFCNQTCYYQERSLDTVFAEVDHYRKQYGVELTVFNDNTINVKKERFLALCNGMRNRGAWSAAIRAHNFDDEMARAAKKCGCRYFVVGVESFLQQKLNRMHKLLRVTQTFRTLDLLHKYDIKYHGNVLVGFPWETREDIETELAAIPVGYNVFPCLVRPYIGSKHGIGSPVPQEELQALDVRFRTYIESKGMTYNPGIEVIP